MWTRSARNKETGKFTVTCTDWNGELFFIGEFDDMHVADRAGEDAERRMTAERGQWPDIEIDPAFNEFLDDISDDELLKELAA